MSKTINDIKNEELRNALWELTNPDVAVGFDMQHHFDLLLDACLKAEKYNKLSEELGCPLDIFVKIELGKITEIIVNYGDAGGYEPMYEELTVANVSGIIESINYPGCLCLETNLCEVPIKDYGKNWWLKGEKDVNL